MKRGSCMKRQRRHRGYVEFSGAKKKSYEGTWLDVILPEQGKINIRPAFGGLRGDGMVINSGKPFGTGSFSRIML